MKRTDKRHCCLWKGKKMSVVKSKSLKTALYRKAVHLSSLWIPAVIMFYSRNFCIVLFAGLLSIDIIAEYSACKRRGIGKLFRRMFIKTLRNGEVARTRFVPSGSVYILSAALFVSVCFSQRAAAAAMSIVLTADACAALVGRFFGTFRFSNGKSVEGTAAFLVTAVLLVRFFFPAASVFAVCLTALLATAAEFFESKTGTDDNFSIPLVSGFILNLISR